VAFLFSATHHFLTRRGLRVPDDVSMVCSDDDSSFAWWEPPVSRMRWDRTPLVRRVVIWALMVFVGFGFLFPRASTLLVALLALTFAWGVEFSQLYTAPWIDAIRATIPGKLVLGNTFKWGDLLAYTVGIALGAWAEWRLKRSPAC
jgi:hypothetical protein